MNKLLKILVGFILLAVPQFSRAEILARGFSPKQKFTLTFEDQVFEMSAEALNAKSGSFNLPAASNLKYQPLSQAQNRAVFFGQVMPSGNTQATKWHFNPGAIYNFISDAANAVERPAQEPKLEINGNKATSFTPPQDGVLVDRVSSVLTALGALEKQETSTALIFATTTPQGRLADTNNLGIKELIAQGVSNFKGSPSNRRHNIKVGVEKFQGLVIAQGEEFSFNKYLGPVEKEQGFLPELVIKKEGTVPELGGGLCQVSSTTFRAAMQAGLPILQRRNHAYAVQYYSPQGTDATIYPGVVDLKFKNDTPGAILVWPHFEAGDTLIFDFYGTKDTRQVTLQKPFQYDRKPDGSMKAEWTRVTVKDGVTATSTFKSVYQSPALFHKTEQFVTAASSTPSQTPAVN